MTQPVEQVRDGGTARCQSRYVFDPWAEIRVERLRLARQSREHGAIHQAIAAYLAMMVGYRGMEAANAAAEELLEMALALERQGQFYTALAVFKRMDESWEPSSKR